MFPFYKNIDPLVIRIHERGFKAKVEYRLKIEVNTYPPPRVENI